MEDTLNILLDVLNAAQKKDYRGYSKFDALNSPFLNALSFNNKWLRFIYTQFIKETPFNLRPLFGVKPSRNPKGIALFARAYLFLYQQTNDPAFLEKGEALIQWLLSHPSPGQPHLCWGYNFIWQSTLFLQDRFEPNAVVTVFVGEALIHAYRTTQNEKYLDAARSVGKFIVHDLPVVYDSQDERAIAYVLRKVGAVVLNNQVLTAALLVKIWKHTREAELLDIARRQMNYTVNRRTDYNAWYYTHPPGKSLIRHDNYHTGGILDGLLEYYEESQDKSFLPVYWSGLEYYQKNLFEPNGAPRWMNTKKYPFDIHGCAQGIISFIKAARHDPGYKPQAEIITNWTISHLYNPERCDFSYRQGRLLRWDYSLMRWCNAWMARAMAELSFRELSQHEYRP
jgi:rhamnogalacturonyl hydrolase YesR